MVKCVVPVTYSKDDLVSGGPEIQDVLIENALESMRRLLMDSPREWMHQGGDAVIRFQLVGLQS